MTRYIVQNWDTYGCVIDTQDNDRTVSRHALVRDAEAEAARLNAAPSPEHRGTRRIPLMDEEDIRAMIREDMAIMKAATQQAWAQANGLSPQYLSDFMTGRRAPGPLILAALGLKRSVVYEAAEAPDA